MTRGESFRDELGEPARSIELIAQQLGERDVPAGLVVRPGGDGPQSLIQSASETARRASELAERVDREWEAMGLDGITAALTIKMLRDEANRIEVSIALYQTREDDD